MNRSEKELLMSTDDSKLYKELNTLKGIFSYLKSQPDWHGYAGTAPKKQVADDVLFILDNLPHCISVRASISGNGEIALFLEEKDNYLCIGCSGNGFYDYYAKINDKKFFGDDLLVEKFPDDKLKEFLALL